MQSSASPARQAAPLLSYDANSSAVASGALRRSGGGTPRLFDGAFIWHVATPPGDAALLCRVTPQGETTVGVWPGRELGNGLARRSVARGGLSGWQRRTVSDFIEAHLGEALRLTDLAQQARLSPFHFARAFKQSFGLPPHRYHVARRIARAKDLLADPSNSVTDIARTLGFAETSSFSSTFRRVTGASPSDFRRGRP
jgi:AraC-like DNA-binding protein